MTNVTFNMADIKRELGPQVEPIIKRATESIATEIKDSFSRPKSGQVYRRRGRVHRASAPGEPPAIDTTELVRSITTSQPSPFVGVVEITDPKAEGLEYGTRKTAARPFAEPALAKVEKEFNGR